VTDIPASAVPDPAAVDVAIFDGIVPEVAYAGPAIYLRPDARTGGASPLVVTGEVERPRFDVLEDDHPLLRWASLRNVNVARALSFELGEGDAVVAGDEGVPLLVVGEREGFRFVALSFDVRDSDLPLRIAWPVLLLDAIGYLTPNEEREVSFARAGEPFSMALPAGATEARLVRAGSIAGRGVEPGQRMAGRQPRRLRASRGGLRRSAPPRDRRRRAAGRREPGARQRVGPSRAGPHRRG
jgi:Ca-activated chloride channel family protein